ncbi:MAG TPA: aminopeptidase N [Alphaproteobacteria bacterium]|nr:aminopeptidase N [Alphaproteobacteria bacterium]
MTAERAILRRDYTPPAFLIETIALTFALDETATRVRSRLEVRRNPAAADAAAPLVLNGEHLQLDGVALDGRDLGPGDYALDDTTLTLAGLPDRFALDIATTVNPAANKAFEGLYQSGGMFCTQCEAEGFRRITYFIDRPDVMARYSVRLEADAERCPVLLSNGNLIESGDLGGGRHYAVWNDPHPKPSYLFALVAGDLDLLRDSFTTRSGRKVDLRIYVERGNVDKCGHAMVSLKKSMKWDEDVYGLEYDLDIFNIVAVGDFNMGAMENKSLNIFNTKYVLAKPETATDTDFQGIESVIAHEYFHNWTGNRITCRDWFQLTLKEGLTVFRDQEFSADMGSRAVKRIADVRRLRASQYPEDAGPMAHPIRPDSYIEINNFYTATVYQKGAEVIRMYHTLLGAEGYRRGIDLYVQRHDNQAVTCDDFLAAMADANGADLRQFERWYAQAGTPEVTARGDYDPAAKRYTLTLSQACPPTPGQPEKQPFHIPVAMGLVGPNGLDLPLRLAGEAEPAGTGRVLELREREQRFVFEDVPERPVPSLLRGFSAPVRLKQDLTEADLAFLLARDSDAFNRWEAGQTLATRMMVRQIGERREGRAPEADEGLIAAFAAALDDRAIDPAFAAEVLTLPGETYIAQMLPVIDVDGIHAVREFHRRTLAEALRGRLLDRYRGLATNEPFSVRPEAMGRRALKNVCLATLMAAEDDEAVALTAAQYRTATNMTDAMAALSALADGDRPEREEALADFYARWHNEALVVDKWLAIQAMSRRGDALQTVQRLLEHPAFTLTNPNKVYALIGSFIFANQARFHDASGAGYRFLANQVLSIDRFNPQVAARMMGALRQWRRFDPTRQGLMKAQLERIAGTEGLSRDVGEIATKSLA